MSILDFQKPDEVIMINSKTNQGNFEFRPLEPGYGLTVGNALRRVLLSSLEGYAITSIKITGVDHEFSTIEGVVQDVTEIILNLKQVRFKQQIEGVNSEKATLKVSKNDTITATDIASSLSNFQVLNPDLLICELGKKVNFPEEVGADRICNTVAAKELIGCPAIIGDIGSATNYDVIDKSGVFIGGAIAPGLETAAHNLFEKTSLLKETAFTFPASAIGKDTATNLQSGIMLGAIDVIDGMFSRIQYETDWENPHNIITGGFGKLISPHLKTEHTLLPMLTLDGIRFIYENSK